MLSVIDEPRLPALNPNDLDHEQRDVYEAIVGGPRPANVFSFVDEEGRLLGPFNAMLYSPAVGGPLQELGAALRFRTSFTKREREIATLVVAARHRSDYEWYAHERIGRQAGLSEAELTALRTGADPVLADARERIVHEAARTLAADGDLSAPVFAEAARVAGPRGGGRAGHAGRLLRGAGPAAAGVPRRHPGRRETARLGHRRGVAPVQRPGPSRASGSRS